jgi:hypothetical protein
MSSIALSPSITTSASPSGKTRLVDWSRYARVGLATVVAAVLANALVFFGGKAVVDYDPDFLILGNVSGIALFTFVAAVVAALVYGGLLRYTRNPVRVFHIVAVVVFVVATIPDFTYVPGLEGASNGQTAILVLTHIVAAAVIVKTLTTRARPHDI